MGFNSKMNWYLTMVKERMEGLVKTKIRSKIKPRNHSKRVQCNFCKTLHFSYSSSSDSSSSSGSSSSSRPGVRGNKQEIFEDSRAEKGFGIPPSCSFKVGDCKYTIKDMEAILKSEGGQKTEDRNFHHEIIKAKKLPGWVKNPDQRKAKKKRNAIVHQPRKSK